MVSLSENGKTKRIPVIQAVLRGTTVSAAKGDPHARKMLVEWASKAEHVKALEAREQAQKWLRYQQKYERKFQLCDEQGVPRPEPIPHPHEIVVDRETHEVRFNGPRDKAEKVEWDRMEARRQCALREIAHLQAERENAGNMAGYDELIREQEAICDRVEKSYPDAQTRREPGFDLALSRRAAKRKPPTA